MKEPKRELFILEQLSNLSQEQALEYLQGARSAKRTGTLTFHLSNGGIASVEWRQRQKTFDGRSVSCSNSQ